MQLANCLHFNYTERSHEENNPSKKRKCEKNERDLSQYNIINMT